MTRERKWLATGGAIAGAIAILAGCNAVLGIDEAKVDPTLGAADGSTGEGGTEAGVDSGGPASCAGYCATVMQNCKGVNQEYVRIETCVAMCQHLEPGLPGDRTQDSLECRNYHAGAAAGDPNFHCRHAGPLGGGHCGTDLCVPYCLLDQALCSGMSPPPYANESACRTACATFPYLQPADAGDLSFTGMSETLNCRLYHLEAAYDPTNSAAASTHCPHTGVRSDPCAVPDAGTD